jgi:hypothetical protein
MNLLISALHFDPPEKFKFFFLLKCAQTADGDIKNPIENKVTGTLACKLFLWQSAYHRLNISGINTYIKLSHTKTGDNIKNITVEIYPLNKLLYHNHT